MIIFQFFFVLLSCSFTILPSVFPFSSAFSFSLPSFVFLSNSSPVLPYVSLFPFFFTSLLFSSYSLLSFLSLASSSVCLPFSFPSVLFSYFPFSSFASSIYLTPFLFLTYVRHVNSSVLFYFSLSPLPFPSLSSASKYLPAFLPSFLLPSLSFRLSI